MLLLERHHFEKLLCVLRPQHMDKVMCVFRQTNNQTNSFQNKTKIESDLLGFHKTIVTVLKG